MNIRITSASRKTQPLSETAAAVFVITREDIRRSGATSIPDLLRMVPGVEVAKLDANKWAVTARGFNSQLSNKLLVLMDGRSVYSPMYSGVFWDQQDTLLEDIDRIEVIRGPGGAVWGANAVNGVISIITRPSQETHGGLMTGGIGTEEKGFGGIRYGGEIRPDAHYRVYAKYFDRDGGEPFSDDDRYDDWHGVQAGFRTDWDILKNHSFTLQGDIHNGRSGQDVIVPSLMPPYLTHAGTDENIFTANLLCSWNYQMSDRSETGFQIYYDRVKRDILLINSAQDIIDAEFRHRFSLGNFQEIQWGMGYRLIHDNIRNSVYAAICPDSQSNNLFSTFVQDEISVLNDTLFLTLGAKFEHNDYTGSEGQPNIRLLWKPAEKHSLWAAVSRAVRTPSRGETGLRLIQAIFPSDPSVPNAPSVKFFLVGNREFDSETVTAYEAGYRVQPSGRFSLDMAGFYNRYKDLLSVEMADPLTLTFVNKIEGETYGLELSADWTPLPWWRLKFAYTFLHMQLRMRR